MLFQNGLLFFETEDHQSMLQCDYGLEGLMHYSKKNIITYISVSGATTSESSEMNFFFFCFLECVYYLFIQLHKPMSILNEDELCSRYLWHWNSVV